MGIVRAHGVEDRRLAVKHVLFVCTQNAGRSQMAEAFFTQLAPADVRAGSAGTAPAAHVHPEVVEVMREVGIDQTLVLRKARECLRAEGCDPRAA